jgi:diguanylate cyclase (GGDEF)-like protein
MRKVIINILGTTSKVMILALILLSYLGSSLAIAQNNKKNNFLDKDDKELAIQPIRLQVLSLTRLIDKNKPSTKQLKKQAARQITSQKIAALMLSKPALNKAEQYLVFILKASLAEQQGEHQQVIDILAKAELLEKFISKKQLNQPLFYKLNLLAARNYAKLEDFDKAYEYKKAYLKKYAKNNKNQKKQFIALLTEKYQTEKKAQENALLIEQNAIEQKKIQQIEHLKNKQQRNSLILISVGALFVMIMFRQFRVRRQLMYLSRTDALTGLVNRKTLFYLGERTLTQAQEHKSPLSVIFFDNDFFKKINDSYGHQVGDEVLRRIAKMGNEVIRSRDIFARIGGEEFVLILPDEDMTKAKAVAEHLRAKIAQHDFSQLGIKTEVTASFGVASLVPSITDFDQLLNNADTAMYQAKEQGRNTVVCFAQGQVKKHKLTVRTS